MNGTRPNGWTGGQYSLLRVLFGAYLFIHFAHLLPWAGELFSSAGVLADGSASPILHLFPNIFRSKLLTLYRRWGPRESDEAIEQVRGILKLWVWPNRAASYNHSVSDGHHMFFNRESLPQP